MNTIYIQNNISQLTTRMLEVERLAQENPNDLNFVLQYNTLKAHLDDLQLQLYRDKLLREKEVLELRLIGKNATNGNLPLDIVGGITGNFDKAIFVSSKKRMFGDNNPKNGTEKIRDTINLRIEGFAVGSTIIYLSANNSTDRKGWSVTEDVLKSTFTLLNSKNDEELTENISNFGVKAIKPISDFLTALTNNNLDIDMKWQTPLEAIERWQGGKDDMVRIKKFLNKIDIHAPEQIEVEGKLITISLEKKFKLTTLEGKNYSGSFPSELLKEMEAHHINESVKAILTKTTIENPFTKKLKIEYSLTNIEGVVI